MAELNAHSERMVFIVNCKVKDTESFKTWTKDRAAKYVYDLKEENSISRSKVGRELLYSPVGCDSDLKSNHHLTRHKLFPYQF